MILASLLSEFALFLYRPITCSIYHLQSPQQIANHRHSRFELFNQPLATDIIISLGQVGSWFELINPSRLESGCFSPRRHCLAQQLIPTSPLSTCPRCTRYHQPNNNKHAPIPTPQHQTSAFRWSNRLLIVCINFHAIYARLLSRFIIPQHPKTIRINQSHNCISTSVSFSPLDSST